MSTKPWTWDARTHPNVLGIFASPAVDLDWCYRLETAPGDAIVGKVLCVCAALAIAREVLAAEGGNVSHTVNALELLDRWIDEPTDARFEEITTLIFGKGEPSVFGPHGVAWSALRTATSSVGNYESGWALTSTCGAAQDAGFSPEQLRVIAERAVLSRRDSK